LDSSSGRASALTPPVWNRQQILERGETASAPRTRDSTSRARQRASKDFAQRRATWPLIVFAVSLFVPWIISLGPIRMPAYRLVLAIMFLPCLIRWLSVLSKQVRATDIFLVMYCCWVFISFTALHGWENSLEPSGAMLVDALGAYMLARVYIRSSDEFRKVATVLFWAVAALLPFALFEALTGHMIILEAFRLVLSTYTVDVMEPRWGLWRVTGPFNHPILFGLCCGIIVALVFSVVGRGKSTLERFLRTGVVMLTASLSLSSGPILAMLAQMLLLLFASLWDVLEKSWKLVLCTIIFAMLALGELLTEQSLIEVILARITLDPTSYWVRALIWMHASESIMNHPLLGTGLGEWDRPAWMAASIDHFWVYSSVTNGLPATILLLLATSSTIMSLCLKKGLDTELHHFRTAIVITMVTYCLVGCTVHFWDAALVLFFFLLGSGCWILDIETHSTIRRMHRAGPRARFNLCHTTAGGTSSCLDVKRPRQQRRPGGPGAKHLDQAACSSGRSGWARHPGTDEGPARGKRP
jgi:hypothetical protein